MDSAPMVQRCFRHQNPEAYGQEPVPHALPSVVISTWGTQPTEVPPSGDENAVPSDNGITGAKPLPE